MNISDQWKKAWWVLVTLTSGVYLFLRKEALFSETTSFVDSTVFLLFIALLLVPIFQEIDLFGIRLLSKFDKLKAEVKEDLYSIRNEVSSTLRVENQVSPNIYIGALPPDEKLPELEQYLKKFINDELDELGVKKTNQADSVNKPSSDVVYLFTVRYQLDQEIRRIHVQLFGGLDGLSKSTRWLLDRLRYLFVISDQIYRAIRDIYSICSLAVHSQEVSKEKINFVRKLSPEVFAALSALPGDINLAEMTGSSRWGNT